MTDDDDDDDVDGEEERVLEGGKRTARKIIEIVTDMTPTSSKRVKSSHYRKTIQY